MQFLERLVETKEETFLVLVDGRIQTALLPRQKEPKPGSRYQYKDKVITLTEIALRSESNRLFIGYEGSHKTAIAGMWLLLQPPGEEL